MCTATDAVFSLVHCHVLHLVQIESWPTKLTKAVRIFTSTTTCTCMTPFAVTKTIIPLYMVDYVLHVYTCGREVYSSKSSESTIVDRNSPIQTPLKVSWLVIPGAGKTWRVEWREGMSEWGSDRGEGGEREGAWSYKYLCMQPRSDLLPPACYMYM